MVSESTFDRVHDLVLLSITLPFSLVLGRTGCRLSILAFSALNA